MKSWQRGYTASHFSLIDKKIIGELKDKLTCSVTCLSVMALETTVREMDFKNPLGEGSKSGKNGDKRKIGKREVICKGSGGNEMCVDISKLIGRYVPQGATKNQSNNYFEG